MATEKIEERRIRAEEASEMARGALIKLLTTHYAELPEETKRTLRRAIYQLDRRPKIKVEDLVQSEHELWRLRKK